MFFRYDADCTVLRTGRSLSLNVGGRLQCFNQECSRSDLTGPRRLGHYKRGLLHGSFWKGGLWISELPRKKSGHHLKATMLDRPYKAFETCPSNPICSGPKLFQSSLTRC